MRKRSLADTTVASNPGGIRVKTWRYARYFPRPLRNFVGGSLLLLVGLVGAIATKGASFLMLYFGLRLAADGYRRLKRIARHFLKGCALPGVVVATEPYVIAALTNLSAGGGMDYDTVKIVPFPSLAKVKERTFSTGDRVPCVALYEGRLPAPKWNNFFPLPAIFATNDPEELARVEASIGEHEWMELNEALFQVPKPYQNGLFPVELPKTKPVP